MSWIQPKPVSLYDFWREIIESGTTKNATRTRIQGLTNVRGSDIATIEVNGELSLPVSMTDHEGRNILSDVVKALFERQNPIFLFFYYSAPEVIVYATQLVVDECPTKTAFGITICSERPKVDFSRKERVYPRAFA